MSFRFKYHLGDADDTVVSLVQGLHVVYIASHELVLSFTSFYIPPSFSTIFLQVSSPERSK